MQKCNIGDLDQTRRSRKHLEPTGSDPKHFVFFIFSVGPLTDNENSLSSNLMNNSLGKICLSLVIEFGCVIFLPLIVLRT